MITSEQELLALYGEPPEASIVKEVDHVHPIYRPFIEAAPFCVLATSGPGGLDASQRDRSALPSAGKILSAVSESRVGGQDYDRGLADRVKATLY